MIIVAWAWIAVLVLSFLINIREGGQSAWAATLNLVVSGLLAGRVLGWW